MNLFITMASILITNPVGANNYRLSDLRQRLLNDNIDLKIVRDRKGISEQRFNIAKAYDYPTLEFSTGATTSSNRDSNVSSSTPSTPSNDLGGGPSTASASYSTPADSWSADLTLKYVAFSKFNITSNKTSTKNQFLTDSISLEMQRNEKQAQLIQLLLETQALKKMRGNLNRAEKIVLSIKQRRKSSKFVYSKKYKIDLEKKYLKLLYQKEKLNSAIILAKEAYLDLLPKSKPDLFEKAPGIKINYPLQSLAELKTKFLRQNRNIKKMDLLIDTYEMHHKATTWEDFYIPNIVLSSSLSKQGDFDGTQQNTKNDVSFSVLFSFNLFEGYAGLARRRQAFYAKELAKKRKLSETQKRILYLSKLYTDATVSEKKYQYQKSLVREKEQQLEQLVIVGKRGSSTNFEKTLIQLEITNAEYDAYEAKKKYHNATLSLALEMNELDKVEINEI
jgi:outer membrane protein TolC